MFVAGLHARVTIAHPLVSGIDVSNVSVCFVLTVASVVATLDVDEEDADAEAEAEAEAELETNTEVAGILVCGMA